MFSREECTRCPEGFFSNYSGAAKCDQCEPGTYSPVSGNSFCLACEPGKHAPSYGSSFCINCQGGTYSNSSGSIECENCPSGTYQPDPQQRSCEPCPGAPPRAWECLPDSSDEFTYIWWVAPLVLAIVVFFPAAICWCKKRRHQPYYEPIHSDRLVAIPQPINNYPNLPPLPPPLLRDDRPTNINPNPSPECIVCYDAPKETVFLPCGHIASCEKCTRALIGSPSPNCPVCRQPIISFVRMYAV